MAQWFEMLCRVVVTLWAVVGIVAASTGSSPLEPKPDKYKDVEGCYIGALDKMVAVGEAETSSDCVLYSCDSDWFDYYTCDITMDAPNCTTVPGPAEAKTYPDCCPVLVCDDAT